MRIDQASGMRDDFFGTNQHHSIYMRKVCAQNAIAPRSERRKMMLSFSCSLAFRLSLAQRVMRE
jgi:hypothetical protein